jgi:hypothetical protein
MIHFRPSVGYVLQSPFRKVQPRRWKVDADSRQDAVLMLSSINLPGGVQVSGFVSLHMGRGPELNICPHHSEENWRAISCRCASFSKRETFW